MRIAAIIALIVVVGGAAFFFGMQEGEEIADGPAEQAGEALDDAAGEIEEGIDEATQD